MTPVWSSALVALSFATDVAQDPTTARHPFHEPLPPAAARLEGSASKFANLSPAQCRKQLKDAGELGEAFKRQGPINGVATPLRVVGPLGEVTLLVPPVRTQFGVLDCRQALLWIELLPMLRKHEVAKIRIDNFYRNSSRIRKGRKSQHAYGLAADVVAVTLDDGRELHVEEDFFGRRGEPPCGPEAAVHPPPGAPVEQIDEAVRLRNLVCDFARTGAFHHILTPNYNQAHEDHLHLDLQRDNTWFSVN